MMRNVTETTAAELIFRHGSTAFASMIAYMFANRIRPPFSAAPRERDRISS
jgi:hypothetical protein